ncbi:hypothetical protein ACFL6E_05365 [Candidatus Neomarinimicrobiota bacterium]
MLSWIVEILPSCRYLSMVMADGVLLIDARHTLLTLMIDAAMWTDVLETNGANRK